jgi:hypothetical protein
MQKSHSEDRLERVNLMLSREESEWLDQLAAEILAATGSKVSHSQIVRAVDRYGATLAHEQYRGFLALPAPAASSTWMIDDAAA